MANNNPDYIPRSDGEFNDWQANFMTELAANAASWNIPATEVSSLQNPYQSGWTAAWGIVKTGNANSAQTKGKTVARAAYEKQLRSMVQRHIRRNPLISAEQLARLGVRATKAKTTVQPPATMPQVDWKPMRGNKMKLFFRQEADEEGNSRRGKPEGVMLIQFVWNVGGTPPTNPRQCVNTLAVSRSPYIMDFEPEEAGQKVRFFARWLNAKGQGGDWTERMEFMVP